jgi:predicted nucleic acid-binding protein
MARLPAEEFTASHWTRIEFSSLIARDVRMGALAVEAAKRADAQFDARLEGSFAVLLPNAEDFAMAKGYLRNYETGLRSGDALHLAVAHNRNARLIYTLDKTLLKAGKLLHLPVSAGIRGAP